MSSVRARPPSVDKVARKMPWSDGSHQAYKQGKKGGKKNHVSYLVHQTDRTKISLWVASEIVLATSTRARKLACKRWIRVAHMSRQLNNLSSTVRACMLSFGRH
jgi:hypothetical protein